MRRIWTVLAVVLLAVIFCTGAYGAEGEYIFRLRQDIMLLGEIEMENVREVYSPEGIYCTTDKSLLRELEQAGMLEYCVPNEPVYLQELPEQVEQLQAVSWPRAMVGYPYGADRGITGRGVRIAIVDSGLSDPNDEFGSATLEQGVNFLVAEGHPDRRNTTDAYGHGTNVTRMIASEEVGVAPEATVIPLRCFDANKGNADCVAAAIYVAIREYQCDVINLSMGMRTTNEAIKTAVAEALAQGVIVVAAAGNLYSYEEGLDINDYFYPAAQEGVIGVGSVNGAGAWHPRSARNDSVFVTAPGVSIDCIRPDTGNAYLASGTSFATPVVSGVAALALSQDPDMTRAEFSDLLARTAQDRGEPGYDMSYGYGIVNAGLLLAALGRDEQGEALSCDEGGIYLSAWRPSPAEETYTACVASYEENGRFCGVELQECTGDLLMNSVPVSSTAAYCKILYLQEQTWAPLGVLQQS